jgi:hypothetical protein
MKKLMGFLLFGSLAVSGAAFGLNQCPGQTDDVLSSCEQYPPFDISDVQRQSHGAGPYDRIYYDLNYLVKEQVLIAFNDGLGGTVSTQQVTKTLPATQHFEISEQYGDEATIAAQVQTFLKGRQIYLCQ